MVSITRYHALCNDCNDTALAAAQGGTWSKTDDGNTSSFSVLYNDYYYVIVTNAAGNKTTYIKNGTAFGKSTVTYPKIRWRFKTAGTINAKIIVEFSDASTQMVLSKTSSTTFTCGSATLTTAKTLYYIYLYVVDCTTNSQVYWDYVMVYQQDFTIPKPDYMELDLPSRNADLDIANKICDEHQNFGAHSAVVTMDCNLDVGTWKSSSNPTDYVNGETFLCIATYSGKEAFQWIDLDDFQFKVTLEESPFQWRGDKHMLHLVFKEYSFASKDDMETYVERFGLNL